MESSVKLDVFRVRRRQFFILFALIGIITLISSSITQYDPVKGLISIPNALIWMIRNFYPNPASLVRLPNILSKLLETILLATASTTTAGVVAFLFGILGSKTTKINDSLCGISRFIASVFRNVPDVVWAMIFLFSFGQSALTGYLALFFVTFGGLTRAFIETIDEASYSSVEALRATGASYFQIIFQAVIPSTIQQFISWILYMIETNIRSATLIGILTGTGIGNLFLLYYRSFNYHTASLVVAAIVVAVFVIEIISNYVRRAIL